MHYVTEQLSRATGDLETVSLGDWITVSELGERYGVGRKRVRAVLHHMGLLRPEGSKYRLTPDAVMRGLGKRITPKRSPYPFDVLGPLAQSLIAEAWDDAVRELEEEKASDPKVLAAQTALADFKRAHGRDMTTQEEVCWLLDWFPELIYQQIATVVDVSRPLVSRYAIRRAKQRAYAEAEKVA